MSVASRRKLVTADELADALKVKPETVRGWSRTGLIPAVRLTPKVIRYDLAAVIRALTERQEARRYG
jgi:predicted site-specific integrase-resolvase